MSPYSLGVSASSSPARLRLLVGTDPHSLAAALERHVAACRIDWPDAQVIDAPPAGSWPFRCPTVPAFPSASIIIRAAHAHEALVTGQPQHTRLVTTQAQYLFCEWDTALAAHDNACLIATLHRDIVATDAVDLLKRRGVFRQAVVEDVPAESGSTSNASTERAVAEHATTPDAVATDADPATAAFAAAFRVKDGAERLHLAVNALGHGRTAGILVAMASVCQEVNDLDSAARDLDEAIRLAPHWAAAHFERGKVYLRQDDMEAAARAFQAAADCLPNFGGAWGNLGATLGELDRTAEAVTAFERLAALDPDSPQAANNLGVVLRETGRLGESEASFRRVIALEPELAFGYYNLGHTLFLQGRYRAAATAYGEGQRRDPEKNAVQASRLAMCRLATGDARGSLDELQRAVRAIDPLLRPQLLTDTTAILWALVTHVPDLAGWQPVHAWLNDELTRSSKGGA